MRFAAISLLGLLLAATAPARTGALPAAGGAPGRTIALDTADGLSLFAVKAEAVTYQGRKAVRLVEAPGAVDGPTVALIPGTDFGDGVVEIDLAGMNTPGAPEGSRGFVGVVFRSSADASRFENIYLRPTNGRADDQVRRNHSTQYTAHPDHPWHRLRKESPGVYESYTDLEPGAWTRMRIEVDGVRARLYVNDAPRPCLIVNDLKLGETRGLVGLWIGPGAEAYFSNLRITPR